jgi:fructokinase
MERKVIVGIGEVLWDVFPDGPRFGGAPANFACCAAALTGANASVHLISAVGNDPLGDAAMEALRDHAVDTTYVSRLPKVTGQVHVRIDSQGHASYQFENDTAWDHLPCSDELLGLLQTAHVVCFGTLGQRSEASRKTIERFVVSTNTNCLRLLDINLRAPYWTDQAILHSLGMANALKLNEEELPIVASLLKLEGNQRSMMTQLVERYSLKFAALTQGAKGSLLVNCDGEVSEVGGKAVHVVDTVGAGDAFTAAMVVGLLNAWPLVKLHEWASEVAAFVCTQAGATPYLPPALLIG